MSFHILTYSSYAHSFWSYFPPFQLHNSKKKVNFQLNFQPNRGWNENLISQKFSLLHSDLINQSLEIKTSQIENHLYIFFFFLSVLCAFTETCIGFKYNIMELEYLKTRNKKKTKKTKAISNLVFP